MMESLVKILLFIHVSAGVLGILLGPVAMFARKSQGTHTRAGVIYHWLVFTVCVSAIPISILHWQKSWFLFLVALFSYSFALKGYRAARDRGEGWLKKHISGMLGSYIAMVTALVVVNAQNIPGLNQLPVIVAWLLPTVIGAPLIARVVRKWVPVKKSG